MTKKIAVRLAKWLYSSNAVENISLPILIYGGEVIISAMIGISLVVLVSLLFHCSYAWLFFLAAFCPLRVTAGGYHANTHWACYLTFTATFTMAIILAPLLAPNAVASFACVSFAAILLFSPVASPNKPQSEQQRKANRVRSLLIAFAETGFACLNTRFFHLESTNLSVFFLGNFAAACSLLVAKGTKRGR